MKILAKYFLSVVSVILFCSVISLAFISLEGNNEYVSKFLEEGDSIKVRASHAAVGTITSSLKRVSYDGKTLELLDTNGRVTISNVKPSSVLSQTVLLANNVYGTSTLKSDTLTIDITSEYDKLYVFKISKDQPVLDVFPKNVKVKIVSKTLDSDPAQFYWSSSMQRISVTALPFKTKQEEIYKAVHARNTLATFSYFEISDGFKKVSYENKDVVILGGNSVTVSE